MMRFPAILQERLQQSARAGNLRRLTPRRGMDFSSNDYLGFAEDAELRERVVARWRELPLGATGSRLLRGNLEIFEAVEARLARFSGAETALILPSGYQANLALHSAVGGEGDVVFSDERNHASIIDGLRLAKARRSIYAHREIKGLRERLEAESRAGLKFIVTESVFSMSGLHAPLKGLSELALTRGALLVVDEAHATGLFGAGLAAQLGLRDRVFASVHTGGKALGGAGAWIACSNELKRYLVNFSRPFIYTTAPSPGLAVFLDESVRYLAEVGEERVRLLRELCAIFKEESGLRESPGPVFFISLGESDAAVAAARKLSDLGYDVRPIRPPTVPLGQAGLRISLRSSLLPECVAGLAREVASLARKAG